MECFLLFIILVCIAIGDMFAKGFPREGKGTNPHWFGDDND